MHLSKLPIDQFSKLPFIDGSLLMFRGSTSNTQVLHQLNYENFKKVANIFARDTDATALKPNSKVFLLPNSTYKIPVIKETCKQMNLRVVNDITKADAIISNDNLVEYAGYHDSYKQSSYLLSQCYANEYHTSNYSLGKLDKFINDSRIITSCEGYLDQIKSLEISPVYFNLQGKKNLVIWEYDYTASKLSNLITDDCLMVLYHILKRSLPVIQDTTLFGSIEKVTIDAEYAKTIDMMLKGSDEDINLAFEILYNCDINKSFYYLVKLENDNYYNFRYGKRGKRTKHHKALIDAIGGYSISNPSDLINKLVELGSITEEIYNDLTKTLYMDLLDTIKSRNEHGIFSVKTEILPFNAYMTLKAKPKPVEADDE